MIRILFGSLLLLGGCGATYESRALVDPRAVTAEEVDAGRGEWERPGAEMATVLRAWSALKRTLPAYVKLQDFDSIAYYPGGAGLVSVEFFKGSDVEKMPDGSSIIRGNGLYYVVTLNGDRIHIRTSGNGVD